jgi:DNA polymerase-3 subunit delta'
MSIETDASVPAESVWRALVGQEGATQVLRAAAEEAANLLDADESASAPTGAMTHSWLFTGPAGSGRSVAARSFAAALQCEDADERGCGSCSACRTVRSGSHPDVALVVPQGLSISVKEMREIVGRAARLPVLGRWQVVIIEDADRLTEGASNALLKAVEEPPERTVFMLCAPSTHPEDVSVTIRSRCRLVGLRTPPASAVARSSSVRDSTNRPRSGQPLRGRATSDARAGWPATRRLRRAGRPCWRSRHR